MEGRPSPSSQAGGGQERGVTMLISVDKDQKPFKCGLCSFAFDLASQLDNHVSGHALTKPFQCGFCQVSYDTSSELTCHVDTHQLFMCVAEGQTSKENLVQVKMKSATTDNTTGGNGSVSRNAPSQQQRGGGISKQAPLRESFSLYNPRRRAGADCQCARCGLKFPCQADLKKHSVSAHADDRPFQCKQCPARFKQNIHLTDHMHSVHCSDKPFTCELCGEKFKIRNYLRNHMARKHPETSPPKKKVKKGSQEDKAAREGGGESPKGAAVSGSHGETDQAAEGEEEEEAAEDSDGNSSGSDDTEVDEGVEDGRTAEDDEGLPHSFLTTSLEPDPAVPMTQGLWTLGQGEMKVEVDCEAGTSRAPPS